MWGIERQGVWHSLSNPFIKHRPEVISGHISCRSTEIHDIIASGQNALILAGRPNIGKSTLIRYLQLPSASHWSWRNELEGEYTRETLSNIHFAQIDLKPLLMDFVDENKLLVTFIEECVRALYHAYRPDEPSTFSEHTLNGLYKLLNTISEEETDETRYFLILDNIEPLGELYMQMQNFKSGTKSPQEYGIALLDRCRAIRTVVDLITEFKQFGFILSLESLPRARVVDQFAYISADLARFVTKTLQIYTMSDATSFLAQPIRDFRSTSTDTQKKITNDSDFEDMPLFSTDEQVWLLNLAGTHPYLLQQCCSYLFQFKAYSKGESLQDAAKSQVLITIYEQISTFLSNTWNRLQEAIHKSSDVIGIEHQFRAFVSLCAHKEAKAVIDFPYWNSLHQELRYILYSEGIVRYDLSPIYYPGTILRDYLVQQVKIHSITSPAIEKSTSPEHGHSLRVTRPEMAAKEFPLSRLEYRLLKTLMQHPAHCTEQALIQAAWENGTERANFVQRLHKLRKKLDVQLDGTEIIENRYGGIYSLTNPDWLELH